MDDPPTPVTKAPSTSSNRLLHRDAAFGDVGSSSTEMLRVRSTTDRSVVGRTPVPRHDGQRPACSTAESFEDIDELSGGPRSAPVSTGALATELLEGEVRREVTHRPALRPRPRDESKPRGHDVAECRTHHRPTPA